MQFLKTAHCKLSHTGLKCLFMVTEIQLNANTQSLANAFIWMNKNDYYKRAGNRSSSFSSSSSSSSLDGGVTNEGIPKLRYSSLAVTVKI